MRSLKYIRIVKNNSESIVDLKIWIKNSPSQHMAAIILHLPFALILSIELETPFGNQL